MATTITGEVERITFENEESGFRVLRVGRIEGRGAIAVVGVFGPVAPGTPVRVTGEVVVDARFGEQLRADTVLPIAPDTLAGLVRYLGSGRFKGIGPTTAKAIVAKFGEKTHEVLEKHPEKLNRIKGLGRKRAAALAEAWHERRAENDLMTVLARHGLSPNLITRLRERYGERAAAVVERSPYRLAIDVHNVGFKTADRIAQTLGIAGDHPERAQAGVLHVLDELADRGHVMSERAALTESAAQMLEIDGAHVEAAIDGLWAGGRVVVEEGFVYTARLHEHEVGVARELARLATAREKALAGVDRAVADFEQRAKVVLAPNQREAVRAAAERKVVVITGGPGVGKTTLVRAILALFDRAKLSTRLCAPTGRAAKRLSESTGREATTIHRLLEVDPELRVFKKNADDPIDATAIVVDEASMIDLPLAHALLAATPDGARFVIVGDADQLPPVGPGAFLRDVIASQRVFVARLDQIFRQAGTSLIVENAHRILIGERPESATGDDADFFVIPRRDPEEAAATVRELVLERIPKRFHLDSVRDIQVLTPMHRGAAGTKALNETLQQALNPDGPVLERGFQKLRVGDKVMQTKNDYAKEVWNGDIGEVTWVDSRAKTAKVRFDVRVLDYVDAELDKLVLAYATTIHKSQGSEYPAVVIPFLSAHFVMLSRNLLYTAVTRAKRLCCLVADPRAISIALGETRKEDRMTRLAERIARAIDL